MDSILRGLFPDFSRLRAVTQSFVVYLDWRHCPLTSLFSVCLFPSVTVPTAAASSAETFPLSALMEPSCPALPVIAETTS